MILWNRKWQPPPVFLPGKFLGQRSLAGYSPWGRKELDMTEHACKGPELLAALRKLGINPVGGLTTLGEGYSILEPMANLHPCHHGPLCVNPLNKSWTGWGKRSSVNIQLTPTEHPIFWLLKTSPQWGAMVSIYMAYSCLMILDIGRNLSFANFFLMNF